MSTDSQRGAVGKGEIISDPRMHSLRVGCDPDLELLFKERDAAIQRVLARQKPELIQQGVDAYLRDLPRLLAENRYLQQVAYRGNELVAIAATSRELWKKLEKQGCTDIGELFLTTVAPLEIDEEDDCQGEVPSLGLSQP